MIFIYTLILILLVGLAGLFALEGTVVIATLFTFGLAIFVVIAIVNAAVYWATLLPMVLLWGSARFLGITLTVAVFLAVACLPNLLGRQEAARHAAALTKDDIAGSKLTSTPKTLELSDSSFKDANCSDLCLALLRGNELDWLRIIAPGKEKKSVIYALKDNLPIVIQTDEEAALAIQRQRGLIGSVGRDRKIVDNLVAHVTEARLADQVVLRQTQVVQDVPNLPLLFWPRMKGMRSKGYALVASEVTHNSFDTQSAVTALGFALDFPPKEPAKKPKKRVLDPPDPPSAEETSIVRSVLERPDDFLSKQERQLVLAWLSKAGHQRDLSPEGAVVVARAVEKLPLNSLDLSGVRRLYRNAPQAPAAILPPLLKRFEASTDDEAIYLSGFKEAIMTTPLTAEVAEAHKPAVQALLRRHPVLAPNDLFMIGVASRFGIDPAPMIDEAIHTDLSQKEFHDLISTICALQSFPKGVFGDAFVAKIRARLPLERGYYQRQKFLNSLGFLLRDGMSKADALALLVEAGLDPESDPVKHLFAQQLDPTKPDFKNCGS